MEIVAGIIAGLLLRPLLDAYLAHRASRWDDDDWASSKGIDLRSARRADEHRSRPRGRQ